MTKESDVEMIVSLASRVESLRRAQVRLTVIATSACLLLGLMSIAAIRVGEKLEPVRCSRLEVVDSLGRTRAEVSTDEPNGGVARVAILDATGRPRVSMYERPDGQAGVTIYAVDGDVLACLDAGSQSGPTLEFRDKDRRTRLLMSVMTFLPPPGSPPGQWEESLLSLFDMPVGLSTPWHW